MAIVLILLKCSLGLVCVLLGLVVMMQRPRSEGLGAAFGAGVTDNIFGAQATHVLARATAWLAGVFFLLTLLLSIVTVRASTGKTAVQKELMNAPVPVATPAASASPTATPAPTPVATPAATPVPTVAPVTAAPATPSATPAASRADTNKKK